jgi:Methyltransferase domain
MNKYKLANTAINKGFNTLYKAVGMPLFQNIAYKDYSDATKCKTGDIELVQNLKTGLVYNRAFNPSLMLYDKNYQNEQSLSGVFQEHLSDVHDIVSKYLGKNNLIEVGCGKGYFLEYLSDKGFEIIGFDKAYEGNNPKIKKEFFDSKSGHKGQGIILRHVLEHIENPLDFLHKLKINNGGGGLIYIEVPCFDWITKNRAWFDICYEHVNYFRLQDLDNFFSKIIAKGSFFGNGQYIYLVADLALLKNNHEIIDLVNFPKDFLGNVPSKNSGGRVNIIWGGATKGCIFSILSMRNGFKIDFAVDINPAKQGRYLAVSGVKIISPKELEQLPENNIDIYLMNSNYLAEVKAITDSRYNYIKIDGN